MDSYVMKFVGIRKITALKCLRAYTGLTLKGALEAVRNPDGFIVSAKVANAVFQSYVNTVYGDCVLSVNDWEIEENRNDARTDLRAFVVETPEEGL